jgi:Protein of unknown function (DUF1648)
MGARLAFAAAAVLYAGVVAVGARSLPVRVPMHFGAGGAPDRFGSRAELIVTEAALGAGVVLLLGAVAVGMRRIPIAWVDVPHPEHWKTPGRPSACWSAPTCSASWATAAGCWSGGTGRRRRHPTRSPTAAVEASPTCRAAEAREVRPFPGT